jgi:hypothetical protein
MNVTSLHLDIERCITLSLQMPYIYGAPSTARNLIYIYGQDILLGIVYIYGRDILLGILLLEPCILLIYA